MACLPGAALCKSPHPALALGNVAPSPGSLRSPPSPQRGEGNVFAPGARAVFIVTPREGKQWIPACAGMTVPWRIGRSWLQPCRIKTARPRCETKDKDCARSNGTVKTVPSWASNKTS